MSEITAEKVQGVLNDVDNADAFISVSGVMELKNHCV